MTLADADTFLGRGRGYLSGKIRKGTPISKLHDDGTIECFTIEVGPQIKFYIEYNVSAEQPCWTCLNCYGDCSWSRDFTPVKGWDATPSIKDDSVSYKIKKCPEYKSEKRKVKDIDGQLYFS